MVESNRILYDKGEKPDHCVVIKYVPYVGDSKRALDEYTSEIFMHGLNTIVLHNTCEVYSCHQCVHSNVQPLFYAPLTQSTQVMVLCRGVHHYCENDEGNKFQGPTY